VKPRRQVLQLALHGFEDRLIQQIAQLGIANQIPQLRLIHRQGLRAALGERRIAVVEIVRDVAE
jgi:hypothetical protein